MRWADLTTGRGHEQHGRRPVVVISHDVFNQASGTAIAMAITGQKPTAGFPLTLELKKTRMPKRSWVKMGQIRTLSTERLGRLLARVPDRELSAILEGLFQIVDE